MNYDYCTVARQFAIGDLVWLSIPTAGKLDPRWEWKCRVKSAVTMEITDDELTVVLLGGLDASHGW